MTGPVLVLGGSGSLGRHICAALGGAGHDVVSLARGEGPPGTPSLSMDLVDAPLDDLRDVCAGRGFTAVVNAAGVVWTQSDDEEIIAANVHLVERLLGVLGALGRPPRLIQLGTTHEYGEVSRGTPITADLPCRPVSRYGTTKLRASKLVLAAAERGRVDGAVLRLGNIFGPGTPQSLLGRVAARLAEAHALGRPAVLDLFALDDFRDFLDIRDAAAAVTAAVSARLPVRVLNVGSGRASSVRSLVTELIAISGVPAELTERRREAVDTSGRGGACWQQVDPGPAEELLRWRPRHHRTESLRAMWEFALAARTRTTAPKLATH